MSLRHCLGTMRKQNQIHAASDTTIRIYFFVILLLADGRCTCEIKSRIAVANVAFNKKNNLLYQQIGLKFEEETSEMLRLEHGSVCC